MADRSEVAAGGVVHVDVEVVDEDGNLVPLGDNLITCTVEGPGELLGLESADNTDMGNWNDNVQRAYRGRLLAYVRGNGSGEIRVRFSAPYIEGAEVVILVRPRGSC